MNYHKSANAARHLTGYSVIDCMSRGFAVVRYLSFGGSRLVFSLAYEDTDSYKGWESEAEAQHIADFLNSTILKA
jgi:hypothetical protein